jgi:hypothetical protein
MRWPAGSSSADDRTKKAADAMSAAFRLLQQLKAPQLRLQLLAER